MRYKKVTFLTAMELWRKKAELGRFSPKTVRNTETFVRMLGRFSANDYEQMVARMERAGVPIAVVAQALGDTQTTILRRYSHMFPNDEQMVLKAFASERA